MAKISMTETGKTGLSVWAGRPEERYLASLQGPAGILKFAEMRRKEVSCYTADRVVELTALQSQWTVVPASDSAEDRANAEFVEQCIGDMSHSFTVAVQNALSANWFGFSLLEIVWKRRQGRSGKVESAYDDGLIGIKKLAVRRQETIDEWLFDDTGGLQGVVQVDDQFNKTDIPIDKLLHFITNPDRTNPEGLALAEVVYKIFHMLINMEIIDGIGAERSHVGLPVFRWLSKPSTADENAVIAMGEGLSVNEKAYVTLPGPLVDFELVSITNTNADALRSRINQYRWEIMGAVFGNFVRLGTTDTGNRALGETMADAFTKGIDAMLMSIAEVFNQHLIPRLFQLNPSLNAVAYPKLQPGRVNTLPLFVLQYLEGVQNWLMRAPDEDNLWLRELMGLPMVALRPEEAPQPEMPPQAQDDQPEQEDQNDEQPEEDAEAEERYSPISVRELELLEQVARQFQLAQEFMASPNGWEVTVTA